MPEQTAYLEGADNWIALYWTLPVPWAGHTNLPEDAAAAAEKSVTIRFQRDLVHREIKRHKRNLVAEIPYMEIDAFRPGKEIRDTLEKIAARCRNEDAGFVYVRFGGPYRVRYHAELESWIESHFIRAEIPCTAIPAEGGDDSTEWGETEHDTHQPKLLYSGLIDPYAHFRAWQSANETRRENRDIHISKVLDTVEVLRGRGKTFLQIADQLNDQELFSTTGRRWNAESLRKFVKRSVGF